jgi:amidohydrolase
MAIDWVAQAASIRDELVARRRDFHQHPETAFKEFRTAGIVANVLTEMGLEVSTGVGQTGVVAVLEGAQDGPTVLIRCDMDALPVTEQTGLAFASQSPGKMHACGHDGHMAIGLGVARLLSNQRHALAGRVKFIFQPAEEIARGAQAMIDDGALAAPVPETSFGLHLWNELPVGTVSVTEGAMMAGADTFTITVSGSGGHAALPDQTRDPILAGAQIVSALQSIVSRNVSGLDTAVVSVTMFHAGEAQNVIPSEAVIQGTFRTFQPAIHDLVERRLREITQGIAQSMGCSASIETYQVAPPLHNQSETNARLREVFDALPFASPLTLIDNQRTMAAEDMAVFLNAVPGTYFFVGSANPAKGPTYPHHHPKFDIDEDALPIGVALLCAAIADRVMAHDAAVAAG